MASATPDFLRFQDFLAELERDEFGRPIIDPADPRFQTDTEGGFVTQLQRFGQDPTPGLGSGSPFAPTLEGLEQERSERQREVDRFIEQNRNLFFDDQGRQIREFGVDPLLRGVRVEERITDPDIIRERVTEHVRTASPFPEGSPEFQRILEQELARTTSIPAQFGFAALEDLPLIEFVDAGERRPTTTLAGLSRRNEIEGLPRSSDFFGVPGESPRNQVTLGRIALPQPAQATGVDTDPESGRATGDRGSGRSLVTEREIAETRVGGATRRRTQPGASPSGGALTGDEETGVLELDPLLDPRSTFLRSLL